MKAKMTSPMSKPFHCSDCGKEFSKEKKLLSHFKVHTTGKSYKCEVCKVTFSLKALYKKHIRTHFDKGSCSCPKCGKVFVRHSWLKRHLNLQCDEQNQNDNKFACRECGKMYDSLTGVRSHLRKGKHAMPMFTCFLCKWVCSSSKSLFIHVLQHSNIDIIVVGIDQEQRLEYFSTSKIRARVDVYKLRSPAALALAALKEITGEEEANLQRIVEIDVDEDLPQTENMQSQNTMQTTKVSSQGNLIPSAALDNTLQKEDLGQYQSVTSVALGEEKLKPTMLPEENNEQANMSHSKNGDNFSLVTPMEPLRAVVPLRKEISDENGDQNQTAFSGENTVRASQSPNDNSQQNSDIIPKKMPKLVSLYPEEEPIIASNACIPGNSNLTLQNELPMSHSMLCNGIPTEPVTNRLNEILMPYPASLVNTMFLPPLFLVQNSLPMTHEVRPQNTFSAGEPLMDNQQMTDTTATLTIMDELKSMTTDITQLRKKKKRQTRLGKKYAELVKQMQQGVSSTDMLAHNHHQNMNTNQPLIKDVTITNDADTLTHSSSLSTSDQPACSQKNNATLPHENEMRGQDNAVLLKDLKTSSAADWFMSEEDKYKCDSYHHEDQSKNLTKNDFWETLMGSDESDKKVIHSTKAGFKNQTSLHGKSSEYSNDVKTLDKRENKKKNVNGNANAKLQQQSPKEGIGVEDYIKKFMWL